MKTQTFGVSIATQRLALVIVAARPQLCQHRCHTALHAAHEKQENNWTMDYLQSAYINYRTHRENGEAQDNPPDKFKFGGKAEWEKQPDGYYHVKYTEGPSDKAWMEARDRNYVFRLEREGKLDKLEPNLRTEAPKLYEEVMAYRAKRAIETKVNMEAEAKKRKAEEKRKNEKTISLSYADNKVSTTAQPNAANIIASINPAFLQQLEQFSQHFNQTPQAVNVLSVKIDQLLQINMPPQKIQTIIDLLPTLQNGLNQLEQKFAQQSSLTKSILLMMEQLGFDSQAEQEQQMILSIPKLIEFYRTIRQQCNQHYLAAMVIHSGMVANNKKNTTDHIIMGINLITDQFPGVSLIGKILKSDIEFINTRNKNLEVEAICKLTPDPMEFARIAETFARRLTIAKKDELQNLNNTQFTECGLSGYLQKGKRLIRELKKGERVTPIQIEAEITTEKILIKTMAKDLSCQQNQPTPSPENLIQDWLEVILGENYSDQSRFSITPDSTASSMHSSSQQITHLLDQSSNSSATIPTAVIDPSNIASRDEVAELKKQLTELQKRDQVREQEMEKIKAQVGSNDISGNGNAVQSQIAASGTAFGHRG